MSEQILVIGGVAAGLSAASRARRVSPSAVITVLERGPVVSYGACGLPYFLSGRVPSLDALVAHPPAFFREHRRIEVLTNHEAIEIEPGRRRVRVRAASGETWFPFDRLILATGAVSRWSPPPPVLRNVFAANTWTQVRQLDAALQDPGLRRVTVVGGGYIGLGVADALGRRPRPLDVTLLDPHAALLHGFAPELADALPPLLAASGIHLRLGARVRALEGPAAGRPGRVLALDTTAGRLETDCVINCAGLRPETTLAAASGIALGNFGGIVVDDRQQTNLPGVFAAGDCAESRHLVTGAPAWIPLAVPANLQGRVAGQNAAARALASNGASARFPGVLGTLAVPLFGFEWGRTGLSLEQARAAGFDAAAETVTAGSQAAYLDPRPVTLQLVYQPSTHRLLGCHLRGAPGTVAGRLNLAAAACAAAFTLERIETLDLVYAPSLSPLYEPLLIAAHNALQR